MCSTGCLLAGLVAFGCSGEVERAPAANFGAPDVPPPEECEPPAELDTSDACAEETVQLFRRQPTIYFILDASGSMGEYVLDGDDVKLDAAKSALTTVATEIGHRARYGLAVFPSDDEKFDPDDDTSPLTGCAPGVEVFPVQAGDPIECVNLEPRGPVLSSFKSTVRRIEALGGTPLSSTLAALTPTLTGQEGTTAAILITDGAPNCNNDIDCEADQCAYNRDGVVLIDANQNLHACDDTLNCCDPDQVGDLIPYPRASCSDISESEAMLSALNNAGVPVYVIGVLGAADFDDAMNRLAVAGGRPRDGERAYYDVSSLDELTSTVRAIGLDLTLTCEIELLERPLYANQLNVYFDAEVVPADPLDGWTAEDDLVTLHGAACDRVRGGEVEQVQLVSGCKTVVK